MVKAGIVEMHMDHPAVRRRPSELPHQPQVRFGNVLLVLAGAVFLFQSFSTACRLSRCRPVVGQMTRLFVWTSRPCPRGLHSQSRRHSLGRLPHADLLQVQFGFAARFMTGYVLGRQADDPGRRRRAKFNAGRHAKHRSRSSRLAPCARGADRGVAVLQLAA